ncbi:MAG: amidohydrolase/deacetylase family metallohydrolase [Patescibacteria group bacterium]|nr:amidohydrolase/deacetylase family metallohydrolase [Patescibacteria group bacterium]
MKIKYSLSAALLFLFYFSSTITVFPQQNPVYDLLLKGGYVIDPKNNINEVMDVAISNKKIARVEKNIPGTSAKKVVDVSGLYVTPGLIDIHVHVYYTWRDEGGFSGSVLPETRMFSSGVTTIVDAGTAGWQNFADFKKTVIDRAKIRTFAFVNISGPGMGEAEQNIYELNPELAADVVKKYPDVAVGIKTAHYWTSKPFDKDHPAWASVDSAVKAARLSNTIVMVDFWPRPPERTYDRLILEKLGPGDIHTHVFAQQFPIIKEDGKVNEILYQAQKRGVILDVGHGAGSFWFRNAARAIKQGFVPNSISTDLHTGSINGPVVDMITTMSKFLIMGLPLEEVIRLSTVTPAKEINHPELGTLSVGSEADVAVIELLKGKFSYADCGKAKMTGDKKLQAVMTIRAGDIVYDPTGISMPEWENAPPPYWINPALQNP